MQIVNGFAAQQGSAERPKNARKKRGAKTKRAKTRVSPAWYQLASAAARNPRQPDNRAPDQLTALTSSGAPVLALISSTVTPGASSVSFRPSGVTSITPKSVMI